MIHGKRIVVVLPAYNAARTLRQTYEELPHEIVDQVILVDDASQDETTALASELEIPTFVHPKNLGYGGNQKTCYREALRAGADVVIMVHPDYQYTPALVTAMASMVAKGIYDTVLGSRLLGRGALKGEFDFMDVWYPIQVKQKDKVGRPDIDSFEAVMMREERTKGFFVSFDYSSDALTEIDRFFRQSGKVIVPFTVGEILDEQIAQKLA